jgi:hypothetical protein
VVIYSSALQTRAAAVATREVKNPNPVKWYKKLKVCKKYKLLIPIPCI